MSHILRTLALLVCGCATLALAEEAAHPTRIIFDTDITGDVDDVLALAMCHTMMDRGDCDLLAVTISKVDPLTGPFTDAVNTFYGRPNLPIGITRQAQIRPSKYLKLVNEKDGDAFRYPHDLLKNEDAPEAVEMLHRTLAAQPDHSVTLIQVGLAVNVLRLLEAEPDLVKQKVRLLSIMAGGFQTIDNGNHFLEANVINDIPAMQKLARLWPDEVPIVWSGYEIGISVTYPRESIAADFEYVPHHPVKEAYLLHSGPHHDRPCWDLTSVLYAIHPDRGYFDLSPPGRVSVENDGFTRFTPAKDGKGRDRFLILNPTKAARVREALVQFVVQPPRISPP